MPRLTAGVLVIALVATACSVEPIEDPGIGAGSLTTTVYAADGSVLTEWHAGEDRVLVSFADLPAHLIDAVVAIEDHRFWIHPGIDVRSVARATAANLEAGEVVQGGSTITQQYVKNVLLDPEVTIERKTSEIGLALRLEQTLTKDQILERYLNTIFFGEGSYGIGAAARRYFAKTPESLTLAEAALLAGLISSPTQLNPYESPNAARSRRRTVLEAMVDLGWLDQGTADAADAESVQLRPRGEADRMRFPYFTDEVRRRLLANPALGDTVEERQALLTTGGLRVFTTVQPTTQVAAETAVRSVVPTEGPQAAMAAIDPRNGHVLALVGGADFYDADDPVAQFNLATQGRRQAGSAFKPFALAAALEDGHRLEDRFPGGRSATIDTDSGDWNVTNHEEAYYPSITLFEATVFSVNVPYAHLADSVGADRIAEVASAAGISSELETVPSIVLGTEEVTVLEMAEAYGTLAAGGIHTDPVLVTRVEGPDGTVLYEPDPIYQRIVSPETAEAVTSALVEVVRRGTGQQAKIGRPVAGKTGTTEGNHDAWFVGYTPELSAAVWVGFAEGNRPLEAPHTPYTVTGGTWPAQVWSRFAFDALSGVAYAEPPQMDSEGLVTVRLDTSTGFLAGPLCPRAHVAEVRIHPSIAPSVVCPIHNPPGLRTQEEGKVPSITGFVLSDAVLLLEVGGYRPTLYWDTTSTFEPGTIIAQDPAPGTDGSSGARVTVIVAGPEPGTHVPDVLGDQATEATTSLQALGLAVNVIVLTDPDAEFQPGAVWAQIPGPSDPWDTKVTVWVSP